MSKRLLILFFMVLVVILAAQEKEAVPQIHFDSTEFNFGKIDQHQKLPFEFKVENKGQGILKLDQVQPTCGCTIMENPPSELAPGASAMIKGTFNSGVYSGEVVRIINVTSNDPVTPKVELMIKSNVIEKVTMEPKSITLPNLKDEKTKIVREVVLKQTTEVPFSIINMLYSKDHLNVTYSDKFALEQKLQVEIDPKKVPEARNNGNIQIDEIKFQVQVKGEATPIEKILYVYLY